jgi:hypothetical protein
MSWSIVVPERGHPTTMTGRSSTTVHLGLAAGHPGNLSDYSDIMNDRSTGVGERRTGDRDVRGRRSDA